MRLAIQDRTRKNFVENFHRFMIDAYDWLFQAF